MRAFWFLLVGWSAALTCFSLAWRFNRRQALLWFALAGAIGLFGVGRLVADRPHLARRLPLLSIGAIGGVLVVEFVRGRYAGRALQNCRNGWIGLESDCPTPTLPPARSEGVLLSCIECLPRPLVETARGESEG